MAYLRQRADGRIEIRENARTASGPRARTLVSFRGALTPDVLDAAERRAGHDLDRPGLRARAEALGIPVTTRRGDRAARELLAQLRSGQLPATPVLTALREALERLPVPSLPSRFAELADWIGVGEAERGRTLRGLLRVSDRIVASRGPLRARPAPVYPHFSSGARARGRAAGGARPGAGDTRTGGGRSSRRGRA